jgi:hypothetical protein
MYKKLPVFVVVTVAIFALGGCQKKSSLTTTPTTTGSTTPNSTASATAGDLQELNASISPVGAGSGTSSGQNKTDQGYIVDSAMIDSLFRENYQIALEDAQKSLKSGVKYCGAKVSFYGATLTETNKQSFIFYSDTFSKDYYWIVSLNGYQNNQKTRSFAARKDMVNELKCMTSTGSAPALFTGAYEEVIKTDKFQRIDPGTIAETTLATMNNGWNVTITDNAGTNKFVTTINPTATESTDMITE